MKAAAGNGTINIAELGLGSASDILESREHAQHELEEMEKPFAQKLAEQKEADRKRDEEAAARRELENPRAPHLVNLNEDPQLSQHVYYRLFDFPVRVGRKTDSPKPQIVFAGVSVQKEHGNFKMLENGLIQFEVTNPEAIEQTLINGKNLTESEEPVQVMNHLDTIYFGQGAMLLFKYPQMKRSLLDFRDEITQEQAEAEEENEDGDCERLEEDEIEALAYTRLMEQGVGGNDPDDFVCTEYTDEEIKQDREQIDWETANEEVERINEEKQ